jgi:hypothetical protein
LIQPDDRKQRRTDHRDAAALSELLWLNRERLLQGKPVRGVRQVDIASSADQENRRLTTLRKEAGQARTRLVNQVWLKRGRAERERTENPSRDRLQPPGNWSPSRTTAVLRWSSSSGRPAG